MQPNDNQTEEMMAKIKEKMATYFDSLEEFYHYLNLSEHLHFPFIATEYLDRHKEKIQIISLGISQTYSQKEFYFSNQENKKELFFYDLRRFDTDYPLFFRSDIWQDFDDHPEIFIPLITLIKKTKPNHCSFDISYNFSSSPSHSEERHSLINQILLFRPTGENLKKKEKIKLSINNDDGLLQWKQNFEQAKNIFYDLQGGSKFVFSKCISSPVPDNTSIIPCWLQEISLNWKKPIQDSFHHSFLIILSHQSAFYSKTPEKLFSIHDEKLNLEALAGTTSHSNDIEIDNILKEKLLANPKERAEHQVVINYFKESFKDEEIVQDDTCILPLKDIQHLYTPLSLFLKNPSLIDIHSFLNKLHPSPAICGEPKDNAFRIIREYENHDRGFYAGAITFGLWNFELPKQSWVIGLVAIRLQLFVSNIYYLFAGAGVMPDSSVEMEWLEINKKLESFRSVEFS